MSDAAEKTAGGATRGLFGALGFILLMLGLEMITDKASIQFGLGVFLCLLSVFCFYIAYIWESWKKYLTLEAQQAIGNFARNPGTWRSIGVVVFLMLIFSPFIEQHRWPFSYPVDASILRENSDLKSKLSIVDGRFAAANEKAQKWQFIHEIRSRIGDQQCKFSLYPTNRVRETAGFWLEQLRDTGWSGSVDSDAPNGTIPSGITIRTVDDSGPGYPCATSLQRALTDIYPNPPSKVVINQNTQFLNVCGRGCVEIDMDY
jgi:hypothetical protein